MPKPDQPSDLTEGDVRNLTRALAETLYRTEKGTRHRKGTESDLFYAINPWSTDASTRFLELVVEKLAEYRRELHDEPGRWE